MKRIIREPMPNSLCCPIRTSCRNLPIFRGWKPPVSRNVSLQVMWKYSGARPPYSIGSSTAYQALVLYGEVKKGEDILVHAGASGVGLAVIHLARLYGAYVIPISTVLDLRFHDIPLAVQTFDYCNRIFQREIRLPSEHSKRRYPRRKLQDSRFR